MKTLLLSTIMLMLLTGCDAPQRTRAPGTFQNMDGIKTPNGFIPNDVTGGNSINYNAGTLTGGTTSGNTGAPPATPGFETCDISSKYHTGDIGSFGLCQSTSAETAFRVKFGTTTDTRNCLIPLFKDASGSSTYIGQPQCTLVNQSDAIINGSLLKNRSGFESYPLNGVIVMKEPLLPAYFTCMHAFINWRPQASCPSGPNSSQLCFNLFGYCQNGIQNSPQGPSSCKAEASKYMANVCNNFKNQFGSAYLDIRTK